MDLTWYNSLNKPIFTPPSWVFAPAWIALYILMAVFAVLIYKKGFKFKRVRITLRYFVFQLILNLLWTPLFFTNHQIFLALIDIFVLWFFIYKTIKAAEKVNRKISYLLFPYIAWVSFALFLNAYILIANL